MDHLPSLAALLHRAAEDTREAASAGALDDAISSTDTINTSNQRNSGNGNGLRVLRHALARGGSLIRAAMDARPDDPARAAFCMDSIEGAIGLICSAIAQFPEYYKVLAKAVPGAAKARSNAAALARYLCLPQGDLAGAKRPGEPYRKRTQAVYKAGTKAQQMIFANLGKDLQRAIGVAQFCVAKQMMHGASPTPSASSASSASFQDGNSEYTGAVLWVDDQPANNDSEVAAVKKKFGSRCLLAQCTGTRSALGLLYGAAGLKAVPLAALEAVSRITGAGADVDSGPDKSATAAFMEDLSPEKLVELDDTTGAAIPEGWSNAVKAAASSYPGRLRVITDLFRPQDGGAGAAERVISALRATDAHRHTPILIYCGESLTAEVLDLQAQFFCVVAATTQQQLIAFCSGVQDTVAAANSFTVPSSASSGDEAPYAAAGDVTKFDGGEHVSAGKEEADVDASNEPAAVGPPQVIQHSVQQAPEKTDTIANATAAPSDSDTDSTIAPTSPQQQFDAAINSPGSSDSDDTVADEPMEDARDSEPVVVLPKATPPVSPLALHSSERDRFKPMEDARDSEPVDVLPKATPPVSPLALHSSEQDLFKLAPSKPIRIELRSTDKAIFPSPKLRHARVRVTDALAGQTLQLSFEAGVAVPTANFVKPARGAKLQVEVELEITARVEAIRSLAGDGGSKIEAVLVASNHGSSLPLTVSVELPGGNHVRQIHVAFSHAQTVCGWDNGNQTESNPLSVPLTGSLSWFLHYQGHHDAVTFDNGEYCVMSHVALGEAQPLALLNVSVPICDAERSELRLLSPRPLSRSGENQTIEVPSGVIAHARFVPNDLHGKTLQNVEAVSVWLWCSTSDAPRVECALLPRELDGSFIARFMLVRTGAIYQLTADVGDVRVSGELILCGSLPQASADTDHESPLKRRPSEVEGAISIERDLKRPRLVPAAGGAARMTPLEQESDADDGMHTLPYSAVGLTVTPAPNAQLPFSVPQEHESDEDGVLPTLVQHDDYGDGGNTSATDEFALTAATYGSDDDGPIQPGAASTTESPPDDRADNARASLRHPVVAISPAAAMTATVQGALDASSDTDPDDGDVGGILAAAAVNSSDGMYDI